MRILTDTIARALGVIGGPLKNPALRDIGLVFKSCFLSFSLSRLMHAKDCLLRLSAMGREARRYGKYHF